MNLLLINNGIFNWNKTIHVKFKHQSLLIGKSGSIKKLAKLAGLEVCINRAVKLVETFKATETIDSDDIIVRKSAVAVRAC